MSLDDRSITDFSYDKVRALLAYLVTEMSRPHRRESLAALLWPDDPEHRARQSLSQAISTLRAVIGDRPARRGAHRSSGVAPEGFIQATRETVWLNPRSDTWLDLAHFDVLIEAVRVHTHATLAGCEVCVEHLEQAVALYRGDFLEDLAIADSAAFEEWALLQREKTQHTMVDALAQLVEAHLERGSYAAALAHGRRQLALDPWREPAHRQVMQALALDGKRSAALAQYESCRSLLASDLGVEPEAATTALFESIRDGVFQPVHAPLRPGALPPASGTPPFMGLRFYEEEDAASFFGREALTEHLIARLAAGERFLAVVGASGSGKSSLVRAGVVATLQHHKLPQSMPLSVHVLTPGSKPISALARALAVDGSDWDVEALTDAMMVGPQGLHQYVSQAVPNDLAPSHDSQSGEDWRLLIVVDQFEELFTLCHDPAERQAFIDNLIGATAQPGPVTVLIALRADFYHRCAEYDQLREGLEAHQAYIGAMSPAEMKRAIEGPVRRYGWSFEPGLVDLLLTDIGADGYRRSEPGALPLLSHALLETWKRREGRTLTLKGYAGAGGVRGAVAQSAEATYRTFTPEEQQIARSIFLRLTEVGDASNDVANALYTRRRASLQEVLPASAPESDVQSVLNTLARARLITMERDAVEVAHEALIREWPTLRGWLEADLEGLRLHRHLTEAATAWVAADRDPADLYHGARLAQAEEWAHEADPALNPLEREFLLASRTEAERLESAREAQRQRELEAAQHLADAQRRRAAERGRLLRWLALAAGLLLVAAAAAGILGRGYRTASLRSAALADANATAAAESAAVAATAQVAEAQAIASQAQEAEQRAAAQRAQQREAEQRTEAETAQAEALFQARVAESNLLAVQSGELLEEDYGLALLLSAESYGLLDTPQTRGSMLTALEAYPPLTGLLHTPVNELLSLAFSPDGSRLAAIGIDTVSGSWLYVWEVASRQLVGAPQPTSPSGASWTFHSLDYSPDGSVLASGGCGAFDDAGDCALGEITLWDAHTGERLTQLQGHTGPIRGLAYDPTGVLLASWGDETVLLWDMHDVQHASVIHELQGHTLPVSAVAFSSDGARLASVGFDTAVPAASASETLHYLRLWDVETGAQLQALPFYGQGFNSLAFSADGQTLAAGGCNKPTTLQQTSLPGCDQGLVRRWNVAEGQEILPPLVGHADAVHYVRFLNEDTVLLTTGKDQAINLWDLEVNPPTVASTASPNLTTWAAMSPDGTRLATAWHSTVSVWDVESLTAQSPARPGQILTSTAPLQLGGLAMSPDGTLLAAGCEDATIRIWNAATREPVATVDSDHVPWDVTFSPDGRTLASGGVDGTVHLWNVETGKDLHGPLSGHAATVTSVAFRPDGAVLASSSQDGSFRLWDVATGNLLSATQPAPGSGLWNATFSPVGTQLAIAVGMPEGSAMVWDVHDPASPQLETRLPGEGGVTQVAFNPEGILLAMATGDLAGHVLLWDLTTQTLAAAPVAAHDGTPWPLAFSPDGKLLASGSLDSSLRLIDVESAKPIGPPLRLHTQQMAAVPTGLAFSPDGSRLYSSSTDGTLRGWDVDPTSWLADVCELAGRNLTRAERAQYRPGDDYQVTCAEWPAGD